MDFTRIVLGEPFTLFNSETLLNKEGAILEKHPSGGFICLILLPHMREEEAQILQTRRADLRAIWEGNLVLTLLRFRNTDFLFEMSFDPTKYGKADFSKWFFKSNMFYLIGVDSSTMIVRSLRMANVSPQLYRIWGLAWQAAFQQPNYSELYDKWITDLQRRFTLERLWERASYVGFLGQ